MIAVMGATGHTGRRITHALLAAGESVRVLGRSEQRLGALTQAGGEIAVGDASDAAFLTDAFRGADAAYCLLSAAATAPDYRAAQDRMGEAIVKAIDAAGVRHVVTLSSLGAELSSGTGPIAGLHAQEQRLRALRRTHVLALRAALFFENFEERLPLITHQGICGDTLAPDLSMPMVGTVDIASVATEALLSRQWQGFGVREILGPRDLSAAQATRLLGRALGRHDLPYIQFSDADMVAAVMQAGLSESFARLYVEMTQAINARTVGSLEGRTTANTSPTGFEQFAEELAHRATLDHALEAR
jgi:uncharacterized protein YbjT (DUF2867 family)